MGNSKKVDLEIIVNLMKWVTRIAGSLLVLLVLFIAVAHFVFGSPVGDDVVMKLTTPEIIMFGAVFLMVIGCIIGWLKELFASLLIISGYFLFSITNLIRTGRFFTGSVFFTFLTVGILYFVIWMLKNNLKKKEI